MLGGKIRSRQFVAVENTKSRESGQESDFKKRGHDRFNGLINGYFQSVSDFEIVPKTSKLHVCAVP